MRWVCSLAIVAAGLSMGACERQPPSLESSPPSSSSEDPAPPDAPAQRDANERAPEFPDLTEVAVEPIAGSATELRISWPAAVGSEVTYEVRLDGELVAEVAPGNPRVWRGQSNPGARWTVTPRNAHGEGHAIEGRHLSDGVIGADEPVEGGLIEPPIDPLVEWGEDDTRTHARTSRGGSPTAAAASIEVFCALAEELVEEGGGVRLRDVLSAFEQAHPELEAPSFLGVPADAWGEHAADLARRAGLEPSTCDAVAAVRE